MSLTYRVILSIHGEFSVNYLNYEIRNFVLSAEIKRYMMDSNVFLEKINFPGFIYRILNLKAISLVLKSANKRRSVDEIDASFLMNSFTRKAMSLVEL